MPPRARPKPASAPPVAPSSSAGSPSGSTTAIDSVTALSSAAPLAITESSPASITERNAEASMARSTVLLAEAMPTLTLSSKGRSAEKPALLALKIDSSRASTVTGPGACTSTSVRTARVAPRAFVAATLPLEPCVAPDSA